MNNNHLSNLNKAWHKKINYIKSATLNDDGSKTLKVKL